MYRARTKDISDFKNFYSPDGLLDRAFNKARAVPRQVAVQKINKKKEKKKQTFLYTVL